jgi:predicted RNA-binding protein YlqC (UPF0109 family)
MAEKFTDKEFVEYIVKAIVANPDDVKVERTVDEMGVLLSLTINQEDMGYVIGKEGRTAKSIRTLLKVVGAKNNARVNLKIIEPEGSTHVRKTDADTNVDTDVVDDLKI